MSLDYSILDTIKLFELAFKNDVFISILISVVILIIIFIINKNRKYLKYIVLSINIILVLLILYYYFKNIITFNFNNPINNIYFYFLNSIIFLIVSSIMVFKTKYKITNYILYSLCLLNITYSLYMTYYFKNITLIVIGNIFPMIKFGNIIYFIYYALVIVSVIFDKKNIK